MVSRCTRSRWATTTALSPSSSQSKACARRYCRTSWGRATMASKPRRPALDSPITAMVVSPSLQGEDTRIRLVGKLMPTYLAACPLHHRLSALLGNGPAVRHLNTQIVALLAIDYILQLLQRQSALLHHWLAVGGDV